MGVSKNIMWKMLNTSEKALQFKPNGACEYTFTGSKCSYSTPLTGMMTRIHSSPISFHSANSSLALTVVSMDAPQTVLVLILT